VDTFYVLAGEVEFTIDGAPRRFGPGGFASAPAGTLHGLQNVGGG
jgi:quercetin dioxygenase-like cupin family protein